MEFDPKPSLTGIRTFEVRVRGGSGEARDAIRVVLRGPGAEAGPEGVSNAAGRR